MNVRPTIKKMCLKVILNVLNVSKKMSADKPDIIMELVNGSLKSTLERLQVYSFFVIWYALI